MNNIFLKDVKEEIEVFLVIARMKDWEIDTTTFANCIYYGFGKNKVEYIIKVYYDGELCNGVAFGQRFEYNFYSIITRKHYYKKVINKALQYI